MKFSIRFKLIAFTFCVFFLVGGTISLFSIYQERERILTTFEKESGDTTALISNSVANALHSLDARSLRVRLDDARVHPDVRYTYVLDSEGIVLADGTRDNPLRDRKLTDRFNNTVLLSDRWISRSEGEILHVGGPVVMADGQRLGYLQVGFSLSRANQSIRHMTTRSFYVSLLCLIIGGILAVLFSASFSRPILSIMQASKEIGEGKLDTRLKIKRGDELGVLAESINRMASDLSTTTVSKAYVDNILESMADTLFVVDADGTIRTVNTASLQLLGYEEKELIGKPFEFVWRDERLARSSGIDGLVKEGFIIDLEGTYAAKDGRKIPVSFSSSAMRHRDGKIQGIVCVAQDISERKHAVEALRRARDELEIRVQERTADLTKANKALQAEIMERRRMEEALRKSEEKYRTLFEESKDVVFISTPEGRFLDINQAGVELFGYASKEELLKIYPSELYFDLPNLEKYHRAMVEQGYVKDFDMRLKRKDGNEVTILETTTAVLDERGNAIGYRGIMRDVTQVKELEERLRHAQKIEAIGRLAGGVAHDFNNILMAITGYSELLLLKMPETDLRRNDVTQILKAAEGGARLTAQLLAFGRKQVLELKILDLNHVVSTTKDMLQRLIGEDIQLTFDFEEPIRRVKADPGQIQQVLMNLAVNARDAMPRGGKLSIQTANVNLGEKFAQQPAGQYVLLSISDNGCGMDKATLSNIFEPFFTTKERGKGTGLGLATVYGIVKQSGGYIWPFSQPGQGTAFKIYFPVIDQPEEERVTSQTVPVPPPGKYQVILLVDDNDLVRSCTAAILESRGYKVLQASDGKQALEVCETYQGPIDFLVSDVIMPYMGGHDLAQNLMLKFPELRVLLMSGYDEEALSHRRELDPRMAFLGKPVPMETLLRKIIEMI